MNSCIYEGVISHARYRPKENSFRHAVFFLCLDLAELDMSSTAGGSGQRRA